MAQAGVSAGAPGPAANETLALPDEQVQAAVAAVLVATLGERFDDPMLELRLAQLTVEPAAQRDHVVHGLGFVRLGSGGDDWLAFRYRTRYDPLFATAGYPEIRLGGEGEAEGERFVPNDAALLAELEDRLAGELESYPGAERVFVQFDDISSVQSGERFLRIVAGGLADFGPGGSTSAHIEAVYDLQARDWLSVEHALGPNIRMVDEGGVAGP